MKGTGSLAPKKPELLSASGLLIGNFTTLNLVGLTGFMRTYAIIAMKLTGVTWVDTDLLGRPEGEENTTAKSKGLNDLLPRVETMGQRTHTLEGFAETLGLQDAPHWASTPLAIQLDLHSLEPNQGPTTLLMKLDYKQNGKPVKNMPSHLRVDEYVLWEWIQTGGENIRSRGLARIFRRNAYLITVRIFEGYPWGLIRKGRKSLAWFQWPDEGRHNH